LLQTKSYLFGHFLLIKYPQFLIGNTQAAQTRHVAVTAHSKTEDSCSKNVCT